MPFHLVLAAVLALLPCLSTIMLGIGQSEFQLSIIMGIAAAASFVLTDYRRIIQLGDWTVNIIVIVIVSLNILDVLHHRGEDLAWSIARVLIFIQIVLLFREKTTRYCWQIIFISYLQVIVASVFEPNMIFALFLVMYVFCGLSACLLLFLQQEHHFFRQHSFIKNLRETFKAEMSERHDHGKLVRLALMTLLMGPLSLILTIGKHHSDSESSKDPLDQTKGPRELLQSLFQIFPAAEKLDNSESKEKWDNVPGFNVPGGNAITLSTPGEFPTADSFRRFPLLAEPPRFFAGTRNRRPWNGRWRELLLHLILGLGVVLLTAVVIFSLVPRIGKVEFYGFTFKPGFENWTLPVRKNVSVSTIGINNSIRLGSLGAVIPYHREVIDIRFAHHPDNRIVLYNDPEAIPYWPITGAVLYLRGIPMDTYTDGSWTQQSPPNLFDAADMHGTTEPPHQTTPKSYDELLPPETFDRMQLGYKLSRMQDQELIFFESGTDLVTLFMDVQPLDSPVFFAPHPFFALDLPREPRLRSFNGRVEESRHRRSPMKKVIVSAAFKNGTQLALTPCQEEIVYENLLQIPESGLETLRFRAAQWDAESNLAKGDVIGRAQFIEQKFFQSSDFSYQLGGIVRDYNLDPLEDFISKHPQGHCEYFAGALAIMLRSVGIGSRVVVGFKSEFNGPDAHCTIRQSDAHAWVEVYVPAGSIPQRLTGDYKKWWENGGWLRLDPTPLPQNSVITNAFSLQWSNVIDAFRFVWNEFVLTMTPGKQSQDIYKPLYNTGHYLLYQIFNWEFWKNLCYGFVNNVTQLFSDNPAPKHAKGLVYYVLLLLLILWLSAVMCWKILPTRLYFKRKNANGESWQKITVEFYYRMEQMLADIGIVRPAAITPLEFARQSTFIPSTFTPQILSLTEAFYRVRFGQAVLTEQETQNVLQTLKQLEHSIEERKEKNI